MLVRFTPREIKSSRARLIFSALYLCISGFLLYWPEDTSPIIHMSDMHVLWRLCFDIASGAHPWFPEREQVEGIHTELNIRTSWANLTAFDKSFKKRGKGKVPMSFQLCIQPSRYVEWVVWGASHTCAPFTECLLLHISWTRLKRLHVYVTALQGTIRKEIKSR